MEKKKYVSEGGTQKEELELIVLVQKDVDGGIVAGDYLQPSATILASVNTKTGELCTEKAYLEWEVKRKKFKKKVDVGFPLKGMTMYRVRVREGGVDTVVGNKVLPKTGKRYLLLKVLKKKVRCEQLEPFREAYLKPTEIYDEAVGKFVLNRDMQWFEGDIDWLGGRCNVMLELDGDGLETAEKARKVLSQITDDIQVWDEKLRSFSAQCLLETVNEWQDEDADVITQAQFMERLKICDLCVGANGQLTVDFDDDNMFFGHVVEVSAHISGKMNDADIVG